MVRYSVLGSGSCGNSYVFSYGGQSILIDAGYSLKQIRMRLSDGGFDFDSILALFVTHLHPDHANAAGIFARKTLKPVYVSRKSRVYADTEYNALNIPVPCQFFIEEGSPVTVGPFSVSCFATSHDSAGSVGYRICVGGRTFVIVTDTGVYSSDMVAFAKGSDILFLESNYDEYMLRHGPYPLRLQKRVAGERGHLSNDQARRFLLEAGFDMSKKPVYLIHISDNNNRPGIVAQAMEGFNFHVCERGLRYCGEIEDGCAGNVAEFGMEDGAMDAPTLFDIG